MKFYVNKEYLATKIEYPRRFTSDKLMKSSIIVFFSIFFSFYCFLNRLGCMSQNLGCIICSSVFFILLFLP